MRTLVKMMAVPVVPLLLFAGYAAPASASSAAARPLPCHASMSNSHPADFTTTIVRVRTVARARITTIAHYRTTNTTHHARANAKGRAGIPYRISGATPGFKVKVDVTVRSGRRKGSCQTSFTPHR